MVISANGRTTLVYSISYGGIYASSIAKILQDKIPELKTENIEENINIIHNIQNNIQIVTFGNIFCLEKYHCNDINLVHYLHTDDIVAINLNKINSFSKLNYYILENILKDKTTEYKDYYLINKNPIITDFTKDPLYLTNKYSLYIVPKNNIYLLRLNKNNYNRHYYSDTIMNDILTYGNDFLTNPDNIIHYKNETKADLVQLISQDNKKIIITDIIHNVNSKEYVIIENEKPKPKIGYKIDFEKLKQPQTGGNTRKNRKKRNRKYTKKSTRKSKPKTR